MKIGFIGLGLMGFPMAENLYNKLETDGFFVYNRTVAKSLFFQQTCKDIIIVKNPQEIANNSDIIIVMLADDDANSSVFFGKEGIFSSHKKCTIINMSTITPKKSIELYKLANKNEITYIEAPVSGTIGPAKLGTLKIFIGGLEEELNKIKDILLSMGDSIFYIGEIGKASIVKLLINSNLSAYMNILAETLNACAYLGLSEEKFLEIINSGPLATVVSKGKGPNIIQGKFQTAFPFEHLLKDVTYTLSLIDEKKLPLISLMKRQYESGLEKEKGKDFSAIYNYYSNLYK